MVLPCYKAKVLLSPKQFSVPAHYAEKPYCLLLFCFQIIDGYLSYIFLMMSSCPFSNAVWSSLQENQSTPEMDRILLTFIHFWCKIIHLLLLLLFLKKIKSDILLIYTSKPHWPSFNPF